ncbi:E3 ubiquitin-protein ligase NEURL3 isoform X2 [Hippocampus comes]|uniref:E3 ubiquitin-protein ligase NEURL3 isoform X2 n=1 Tax=Hippocampus comes TaxID=109280 RepID=UPI00094F3861|nr:PREDICTED: E3 ubiquitin-protein ligase NEURL3-like isoform X2 [Hippocampus comes]
MHSCYKCTLQTFTFIKAGELCLFFKLLRPDNNYMMARRTTDDKSRDSRTCGFLCLGPMMFHHRAVGDRIHLSHGCRHAKRAKGTFRDGLVFSNRPVRVNERIRLRIENVIGRWHGALRVGFTNVNPDSRNLPLPKMAIPDLTCTPGHWATVLDETFCKAGTELEFWRSSKGNLYVSNNILDEHRLLPKEINVRGPLWAMIDLYGQTCSIVLLGSVIRGGFFDRKSCKMSVVPRSPALDPGSLATDDSSRLNWPVTTDAEEQMICVVCLDRQAQNPLPCGHCCLCLKCSFKIFKSFGTCPLCRQSMGTPVINWVAAP